MKPIYSYYLLSLLAVLFLAAGDDARARQDSPPHSWSLSAKSLEEVEIYQLPAVDRAIELAKAPAAKGNGPVPFAVPSDVALTPENAGTWTDLADGSRIWRLRFHAAGATDFNFGFVQYQLPAGAELHIYSEDLSYYQGPYTSRDNKPHHQLWTPVVPGSAAVVELFIPAAGKEKVLLELGRVSTGFRDLFGLYGGPGLSPAKQGSCNNDVICSVGDPWRNEIRSVAGYGSNGFLFCTGTLIMDVPGSFRPFFLTADHCGISAGGAPTMVVYWNFESPGCGLLSGGSLAQNQTGATFRADRADVDMTLLELDEKPDPAFDVYYSGWDASGSVPQGSVSIHHPNGDEKAISFNVDPLTTMASCIRSNSTPNTHWRIDNWEDGTTEPGSSGSGLWNPASKKLVGFLSGGTAACNVPQGSDCYGKFSVAWDGPVAAQRLKDWLDPAGTGTLIVDGSDPGGFTISVAPVSGQSCAPGTSSYTVQSSARAGFSTPVTLSVNNLPAGVSPQFSANPVIPGNSSQLTLTAGAAAAAGSYDLSVRGSAGTSISSQPLTLSVLEQTPAPVALTVPSHNAANVALTPVFSWNSAAQATSYHIEVSSDAGFTTIIDSADVSGTSYQPVGELTAGVTYYWRVRAGNACGESTDSDVFSFTTATTIMQCRPANLTIPDDNVTGVSDTLTINSIGAIDDLNISLDISHTYVGDLIVTLRRENSDVRVVLIDRPGFPAEPFGCDGSDIAALLDDASGQPVENECAADAPAIAGTLRPDDLLAVFNGEPLSGNWILSVSDNAGQDTGTLNQWCLESASSQRDPAIIFQDRFEN